MVWQKKGEETEGKEGKKERRKKEEGEKKRRKRLNSYVIAMADRKREKFRR